MKHDAYRNFSRHLFRTLLELTRTAPRKMDCDVLMRATEAIQIDGPYFSSDFFSTLRHHYL